MTSARLRSHNSAGSNYLLRMDKRDTESHVQSGSGVRAFEVFRSAISAVVLVVGLLALGTLRNCRR